MRKYLTSNYLLFSIIEGKHESLYIFDVDKKSYHFHKPFHGNHIGGCFGPKQDVLFLLTKTYPSQNMRAIVYKKKGKDTKQSDFSSKRQNFNLSGHSYHSFNENNQYILLDSSTKLDHYLHHAFSRDKKHLLLANSNNIKVLKMPKPLWYKPEDLLVQIT